MPERREALWLAEEGRPVEVDQGALIHKILARYPGEFSLFREMLQNSDDARSNTVEIHFETAASRGPQIPPDLKPSDIVQWSFKNNGDKFTPEDWNRLAKIAKGNTNSAKVGAFGVGFYSLFSVTDRPVVLSGGRGMEFYWSDDVARLYVREGNLPPEEPTSPWTIFKIPLREPGPTLAIIDLLRFLAMSITFMVHLKDVKVVLDGCCIGHISKSQEFTKYVDFPIALERSSPLKMMAVDSLQCRRFTIEAKLLTGVQKPSQSQFADFSEKSEISLASTAPSQSDACSVPLSTDNSSHIHHAMRLELTVFTAEVHVEVNEKLSKELLRCTSKRPPCQLNYNLVYIGYPQTGKDEYDQSFSEERNQSFISVFQGLRADLDGALYPRIFIGHSTSQTTGIGGHMASSFISTVERESMDLVDKNVAVWNKELLYVGGFLARTVYELELSAIQTSWEEAVISNKPKFQDQLRDRFVHVVKFFTFHESTPSPKVASLLQHAFYSCSPSPLRFLSSAGVRHTTDIRSFDLLRSQFLKSVPLLSPKITEVVQGMTAALPSEHKIRPISVSDMLRDLCERTLDERELITYLQWQSFHGSAADMTKLLEVITFLGTNGTNIKLSTIRFFVDSNIPSDGPIPPSVMHPKITRSLTSSQLKSFRWREFTITDWLRYISQLEIRLANPKYDFIQSVDWAEHVLRTVSLAWSRSHEIRDLAKEVFANKRCIPIMHKLCSPEEAYLPSWNIPASDDLDLQVVRFPSGLAISWEMEQLLVAVGVRQHVAPRLLLTQMVETGRWNTSDLINYLVQVADTLSLAEVNELKSYDAFAGVGDQTSTSKARFCAGELYPPLPVFQQLRLRLIDWKGRSEWRDGTPEAELMYRLGLRRHPPLEEIVKLCSQDSAVGKCAFDYLCANLQSTYSDYNPDSFQHVAFVPAVNASGPCLAKLEDVFSDNQWKALQFSVVQHGRWENILGKLGVRRHPPPSSLLRLLKTNPPPNEEIARQWFEILSNHITRFGSNELDTLSRSCFVPVATSKGGGHLPPVQCYLERSPKYGLYSNMFHFVSFGVGATLFLRACGAKNEPSAEDIAEYLINNHDTFYRLAGHERFLQELHDLAARRTYISNNTICKMRLKPVLLGTRREKTENADGWQEISSLWKPMDIVIVNDIHTYQLFSDSIVAAPQNMPPELEELYVLLGCKCLTKVVRDEYNPSNEKEDATPCSEYRAFIEQRLLLCLRHYRPLPRTSAPRFSGSITVRICEYLSVSKTLTIGDKEITKRQCVWATAKDEEGTIQVWISSSAKQDVYELAVSLCRVLFGAVNLNDALLFTSILSEDLDVLKGRGYGVDRVLQPPRYLDDLDLVDTAEPPSSIASEIRNLPSISSATQHRVTQAENSTLAHAEPTARHSLMVGGIDAVPDSPTPLSESFPTFTKVASNVCGAFRVVIRTIVSSTAIASTLSSSFSTRRQVVPRSYIQSAIEESIQMCIHKPLPGHHRSDAGMIDFLNDGYCNVSQSIENLGFLGSVENVNVYSGEGISDVNTFMERTQDQLSHFVRIISRIAEIYGLPMGSLRIFYDDAAGCIAFNHKGTVYLNLRYFEAWHYQEVKSGNARQALSSWFLTLAHEIAHNLVTQHGSEHEFWSAAICEAHLDAFSQLLRSPPVSE